MLSIRDLRKSHGGRTLFENASLQVNYGERVALVGPNGAGKSTLFSIILHTEDPDAGTVEREAWTISNWLTHAKSSTWYDAEAATSTVEHALGLVTSLAVRRVREVPEACPSCGSNRLSPERGENTATPGVVVDSDASTTVTVRALRVFVT